ncbi:hypothetical protein HPP92_016856 [Vanilla planifolia]|uniref:Uncharacterized protein n=1 Tax=Vanilla planifolia TaxID=51239 RepID=A0A835QFK4_VANPL|nr:hypothetical protein HPP92_016856 [Vanilla planifolia]
MRWPQRTRLLKDADANPSPISLRIKEANEGKQARYRHWLFPAASGILIVNLSVLIFIRQRKRQELRSLVGLSEVAEGAPSGIGDLRRFWLRELQMATDNFSSKNLLGKGLADGTVVAVKRLRDGGGSNREAQFRTELEMISLAVHRTSFDS